MPVASVISEHLGDPEYLHVLLNPLPVYGLAVGVLGLLLALISRTRTARVIALTLIFVGAISAWPAYHYGEAAYDRVKAMADSDGDRWLDEHMRRGEQLIYVFYVVAALSAGAVLAEVKLPRAAVPLAISTLILASANLGVGVYIAYAGGHVRHREFRFEPAPAAQIPEHHHHGEGEHEQGRGPQLSSAPAQAEHAGHEQKPGAEKPLSEEERKQLEASRLQLEASRLQLEASRKQLEVTGGASSSVSPSASSPAPPTPEQRHEHHPPQ
jgi:disulfide bond formation protein DsbB